VNQAFSRGRVTLYPFDLRYFLHVCWGGEEAIMTVRINSEFACPPMADVLLGWNSTPKTALFCCRCAAGVPVLLQVRIES
jgi:hypothetical protein